MNQFLKQVIEEKFVSKKQQRFFYAKANEKGASKKEKKKWSKWAKEFSDKTDFEKIPEKVEKETEVDEIVDADGNGIGIVTSGTMAPSLNKGIGMGYVTTENSALDSEIFIRIRKKDVAAKVVKMPFYKN